MQIVINDWVFDRIKEFYDNAAKSYPSLDVDENVDRVCMELYKVGTSLQPTTKTLPKWKEAGYQVCFSRTTKWYFAYRIANNIIYVEDAEYGANMSNKSYTATANIKTDNNYNPNKQFISDHKRRRPITLIISERQLPIIKQAMINEYFERKMQKFS